jgi:hypothetical protein
MWKTRTAGFTGELVLMNEPKDIIRRMLVVMCTDNHPFFIQKRADYKEVWEFVYGLSVEAEIIDQLETIWEEQEEHF